MDTAAIFLISFQPHNNANKLGLKKPDLAIRTLSDPAIGPLHTPVDNSVTSALYTHQITWCWDTQGVLRYLSVVSSKVLTFAIEGHTESVHDL